MQDKRRDKMRQVLHDIVHLTESPLYDYRVKKNYFPVIGQGSYEARIMFIGEAPGENEAKTGRPFCGASGRVLDELLASIKLKRDDVYITNVVKDRPPKNRDPHKAEIKLYAPFLERQIEIIQPQVFATLGRFSMEFILGLFDAPEKSQKIGALHGKTINVQTSYGSAQVVPMYHPAVALYNAGQKQTLLEDFKILKQFANP